MRGPPELSRVLEVLRPWEGWGHGWVLDETDREVPCCVLTAAALEGVGGPSWDRLRALQRAAPSEEEGPLWGLCSWPGAEGLQALETAEALLGREGWAVRSDRGGPHRPTPGALHLEQVWSAWTPPLDGDDRGHARLWLAHPSRPWEGWRIESVPGAGPSVRGRGRMVLRTARQRYEAHGLEGWPLAERWPGQTAALWGWLDLTTPDPWRDHAQPAP